jgi:hypothetical protein
MALVMTVEVGKRTFDLYGVTGEVLAEKTYTTTSTSGGGSVQNPDGSFSSSPVTTTTTTHDQLVLRDDDGTEHAVHVTDTHLVVRPGHRLSVLWGARPPSKSGPYVAIYNHDTRVRDHVRSGMGTLVRPWPGIKTAIFFLSLVAAAFTGAAILVFPALFVGILVLCVAALVKYLRRMKALAAATDDAFEKYIAALPEAPKP